MRHEAACSLCRFGRVHFGIALAAFAIVLFACGVFATPGLIPGVCNDGHRGADGGRGLCLESIPRRWRVVLVHMRNRRRRTVQSVSTEDHWLGGRVDRQGAE